MVRGVFAFALILIAAESRPESGRERKELLQILNSAQRSLYPAYDFRTPTDVPNFSRPPVLAEGEKIEFFQGAVYFDNRAAWVVKKEASGSAETGLLIWNLTTGDVSRVLFEKNSGIWALAYDPTAKQVIIGRKKELNFMSPSDMRILEKKPFTPKSGWVDLIVAGNRLVARTDDQLDVYDRATLDLKKTLAIKKNKTQRMIAYSGRQVVLASTYWGAETFLFDIDTGKMDGPVRLPGSIHYYVLLKTALMENGRLGVFDITEKKFLGVLEKQGDSWLCLTCDVELLPKNRGYRYPNTRQTLTGLIQVTAVKDTAASSYLHVLFPKSTYGQEIEGETFSSSSSVVFDKLGNRYLKVRLPALRKGETYSAQVYAASITRYVVHLNLSAAQGPYKVPDEFKIYLQNDPILDMQNPVVTAKLKEVTEGRDSATEKIQAINRYATTIKGVWDDRFDPAPQVILQNHGGCNEHTRVQLALMRRAGIPSRYAWNTALGEADKGGRVLAVDHAIAEAWLPELGWVPLEGLFGTAGSLNPYLITFIDHLGPNDFRDTLRLDAPIVRDADAKIQMQFEVKPLAMKERGKASRVDMRIEAGPNFQNRKIPGAEANFNFE